MPELPEVETITRQLNEVLVGQRIVKIEVLSKKSFVGKKNEIKSKKILGVKRRAKMAIIELASSDQRLASSYLLIHLKMTGQLIYQDLRNPSTGSTALTTSSLRTNKHTRVIFHLSKGRLFFNDQRLFGWIKVVDSEGLKREFKNYGPDIIDKAVTQEYFYSMLQKSRRAVKLVIIDQAKIAGVGNIYVNEGLWRVRIDPRRPANRIRRQESNKLLAGLKQVVRKGIKYGGATASDEAFVNASGLGGKYQEHFLVYEQAGEKCHRPACRQAGVKIKKIRLGGRGTYYCPGCQK